MSKIAKERIIVPGGEDILVGQTPTGKGSKGLLTQFASSFEDAAPTSKPAEVEPSDDTGGESEASPSGDEASGEGRGDAETGGDAGAGDDAELG